MRWMDEFLAETLKQRTDKTDRRVGKSITNDTDERNTLKTALPPTDKTDKSSDTQGELTKSQRRLDLRFASSAEQGLTVPEQNPNMTIERKAYYERKQAQFSHRHSRHIRRR